MPDAGYSSLIVNGTSFTQETRPVKLSWSPFDQLGKDTQPGEDIINDDDDSPELVHDDSSVESDSGYSNNGSASTRGPDEEDIQTAENVNDETEHGYSSIDEDHRRTADPTRRRNPSP